MKVGDVVRLSVEGSQRMTVSAVEADGVVECTWFAGGEVCRNVFAESVLCAADPTWMDEGLTGLDFGQAIRALKAGRRVTREGWNGKGMWLAYQKAYPEGIPINANTAKAIGEPEGTMKKFLPYLMLRTAGEGCFVPWLASQSDALAEDWCIVAS